MMYVIMCGGDNHGFETPRHLSVIDGESLVERTIRLLHDNGIRNIKISTNNLMFFEHLEEECKIQLIPMSIGKDWVDGFRMLQVVLPDGIPLVNGWASSEGVCFLFGDVYYSELAIKTIVESETDDIEFFASSPPFSKYYVKEWAEPFGFKVKNAKKFVDSLIKVKQYKKEGKFKREPIAWELWQVIKDGELNVIDYYNYTAINDYTCDVDEPEDIEKIEEAVKQYNIDINKKESL